MTTCGLFNPQKNVYLLFFHSEPLRESRVYGGSAQLKKDASLCNKVATMEAQEELRFLFNPILFRRGI